MYGGEKPDSNPSRVSMALMSLSCSLIFANEQAICLVLLNEAFASRVTTVRRDGIKGRGGRRICNAMRMLM